MPNSKTSDCKFSAHCDRGIAATPDIHRPSIGRSTGAACPFPGPVAELAWAKGDNLFHQGDKVKGGYSLRAGLVALERVDEHGELAVLKLLQPGSFFPCADLFGDGTHGATARALADSAACFIPADKLMALIKADARVGFEMAKRGCEEARENEDIIFRLCAGDLAERVMGILESLGREIADPDEYGTLTFGLPFSWRELATMVGTSPEVISRLLRKMSDGGRLSFTGRTVTLFSPSGSERATG